MSTTTELVKVKAELDQLRQGVKDILDAWGESPKVNTWLTDPADDWERGYAKARENAIYHLSCLLPQTEADPQLWQGDDG